MPPLSPLRSPRERGRGLSPAHIPPRPAREYGLGWYENGEVGKLTIPFEGRRGPGGRRGAVVEFSSASRRRLLQLLGSVDRKRNARPYFLTLTYPDRFPDDPEVWKNNIDAFRKWLDRSKMAGPFVWRLEFQTRKSGTNKGKTAPHFHLLVFTNARITRKRQRTITRAWARIVGSGDRRHERAGTNIMRARSWDGVMGYAAKYMAKTETIAPTADGELRSVGRFWGTHHKSRIHRTPQYLGLDRRWALWARRAMRRWQKRPSRAVLSSCTMFGRSSGWEQLHKYIEWHQYKGPPDDRRAEKLLF